eukprot:TRINITY_DN4599_c0_g1_i1.p1 TRINITY_DN4599_c0_g1~~TRINITY_DN4599_c0_g1_i1.p1  ORF type:complete len:136 (-),score=21.03 TRINITY_DN4599_c0_g1_i1:417-824(-)
MDTPLPSPPEPGKTRAIPVRSSIWSPTEDLLINFDENDTIEDLKTKIQDRLGISPNVMVLSLNKYKLPDDLLLTEIKLLPEQSIEFTTLLKGNPPVYQPSHQQLLFFQKVVVRILFIPRIAGIVSALLVSAFTVA